MKKSLVAIILLLIAISAFTEFKTRARAGLQFLGKHEVSILGISGTADVNIGFSFSPELLYAFHDNFEAGIGLEYQIGRSQTKFPGDFNFASLYGVVIFPLELGPITPFILGRIGYNLFFGDYNYTGPMSLDGGLYFAVGGGISFLTFKIADKPRSIFLESTYSQNYGSASYIGYTANVIYSKIDVFLGVEVGF